MRNSLRALALSGASAALELVLRVELVVYFNQVTPAQVVRSDRSSDVCPSHLVGQAALGLELGGQGVDDRHDVGRRHAELPGRLVGHGVGVGRAALELELDGHGVGRILKLSLVIVGDSSQDGGYFE